jgi:hypothetical protein
MIFRTETVLSYSAAIRQRAHSHSSCREVRVTYSPSIIDPLDLRAAEAVYFTSTRSRTK